MENSSVCLMFKCSGCGKTHEKTYQEESEITKWIVINEVVCDIECPSCSQAQYESMMVIRVKNCVVEYSGGRRNGGKENGTIEALGKETNWPFGNWVFLKIKKREKTERGGEEENKMIDEMRKQIEELEKISKERYEEVNMWKLEVGKLTSMNALMKKNHENSMTRVTKDLDNMRILNDELVKKCDNSEKEKNEVCENLRRYKEEHRKIIKELQEDRLKIFQIDEKEIKQGAFVARGSFGEVHRGEWTFKRPIALKKINFDPNFDREEIIREFQDSVKLIHPNVLRIFGYYQSELDQITIVMENMETDVLRFVSSKNKPKMSVLQKFNMMHMMAASVNFLHSRKIVHRDIKGVNFLVRDNGKDVKICDFGLVKSINSVISHTANQLNPNNPRWQAPEVIGNEEYSVSSDIYALACAFYEVLYENFPFYKIKNSVTIMNKIINKKERPDIAKLNGHLSTKPFIQLLNKMWHDDKDQRPSSQWVMKWFVNRTQIFKDNFSKVYFP